MAHSSPRRRSSPAWVRQASSEELHAIAFAFLNQQTTADLSERQEWLWTRLIDELEWRWHHTRPSTQRCYCGLCRPPF